MTNPPIKEVLNHALTEMKNTETTYEKLASYETNRELFKTTEYSYSSSPFKFIVFVPWLLWGIGYFIYILGSEGHDAIGLVIYNIINLGLGNAFVTSIGMGTSWLIWIAGVILISGIWIFLEAFYKSSLNIIKKKDVIIKELIKNDSSIESILTSLDDIQGTLQNLAKRKAIFDILCHEEGKGIFNNLISSQIAWIIDILPRIQDRVRFTITEQQKVLEQAKSEVEQTIKGSTELQQVSELQQVRLDRQIEQFEELQRVLVKV